jgi:hypothetical protein
LPEYLLRAIPVNAYSPKAACAASAVHHAGGVTIVMAFTRQTEFQYRRYGIGEKGRKDGK